MTIENTKEIVFKHLRNSLLSHADNSMRTAAVLALLRFLCDAEIATETTDGNNAIFWYSDWTKWSLPEALPSARIKHFFEHSNWNEFDETKSQEAFRQGLRNILNYCNFETRVHVGMCLLMLAFDLGIIDDKKYENYAIMLHRKVSHFVFASILKQADSAYTFDPSLND